MKTVLTVLLLSSATPALAQHVGHTMPMPDPAALTPAEVADKTEAEKSQTRSTTVPSDSQSSEKTMDHGAMGHGVMDHSQMNHSMEASSTMEHSAMGHETMPEGSMDHSKMEAMGHSGMDSAPATDMAPERTKDQPAMDHSAMAGAEPTEAVADSAMDHSKMDHSQMNAEPTAQGDMEMIPSGPPPASAGTGPARAADAIWGREAMREARKDLKDEMGRMTTLWFMGDRVEYRAREGDDGYLFDVQGYYGGDINKFWFKSEGEGSFGEKIESAEVQALYSRAIAPFFDFQAGIRQDYAPMDRTYAVVGIQGLAPYLFEVDAAAFLSDKGDLTARVEAELDQRVTQRLILQPRAEVNLAAQDVPELGIGAGFDSAELGVRLRYEFTREFAPYIGVEQEWTIGQSADYARADGEDTSVTNYVVGVRFWF